MAACPPGPSGTDPKAMIALSEPLLKSTVQTLAQTEHVGDNILAELHHQRKALEFASGRHQTFGRSIDMSGESITRQLKRIDRRRCKWLIALFAFFLFVVGVIIFKVCLHHAHHTRMQHMRSRARTARIHARDPTTAHPQRLPSSTRASRAPAPPGTCAVYAERGRRQRRRQRRWQQKWER